MGLIGCAVVGCDNTSRHLDTWKKSVCKVHDKQQKECGCNPPFRLYCFPGKVRYQDKFDKWTRLIRRQNADKSDWMPTKDDRVCSLHFVDGIPTEANPNPTLQLGYKSSKTDTVPRRPLIKSPIPPKRKTFSSHHFFSI